MLYSMIIVFGNGYYYYEDTLKEKHMKIEPILSSNLLFFCNECKVGSTEIQTVELTLNKYEEFDFYEEDGFEYCNESKIHYDCKINEGEIDIFAMADLLTHFLGKQFHDIDIVMVDKEN